jgi:N-acetylneuraminic acid mutarotase
VDGLIYVIGGSEASNRRTRAVQVYDPSLEQWSRMQDAPAGWDFHTAVAINRRIHVISGALDDGAHRGHWVLDLRTGYWQQRAPIAVAVNAATAQVVDGDIHVFGGVVGRDYRSLIQIYDPETDTWRFGGDLPTGRLSSVSGMINRRVHLVGGGIPEYQTTPQHLIFDASTSAIATARDYPHAMEAGGGGVVDGVFCVFGGRLATQGRRNEPFSDTNCYADGRWIELPPLPTPRAEMAHVTLDGMIYAIGGDGARPSMDTVERLVIVVERP